MLPRNAGSCLLPQTLEWNKSTGQMEDTCSLAEAKTSFQMGSPQPVSCSMSTNSSKRQARHRLVPVLSKRSRNRHRLPRIAPPVAVPTV